MSSHRALVLAVLAVGTLLSAPAARAQEKAPPPPHIRTAQTFLMAWGNQRWDELQTVAGEKVTVKVGDKGFILDPAAQKSEVTLVFPFRGLSTVREGEKVKGITVEELGLKVGDSETRGAATLELIEKDGEFRVLGVSTAAPQPAEKK